MRAILTNPRYTGHEVWTRQRRDYDLLDPTSPAEGHVRRMRWNKPESWIWSPEPTHEALVERDEWQRFQSTSTGAPRAQRRHETRYLLRGRVRCAVCGRRMTGTIRGNDRRYYRCELRRSRPGAPIDHPVDVYVRERALVDALDDWLDELFAPERAATTAQAIVAAAAHDRAHQARVDQAQRALAEARRRLAQYHAALDSGADAATVTGWITETAAEERAAVAELEHLAVHAPAPLTTADALAVVGRLGGMPGLLEQADQDDRAALYTALGVSATYAPDTRSTELTVVVPRGAKNVSEGGHQPQVHATHGKHGWLPRDDGAAAR